MSRKNRILIINQFFHPEYVTAAVLITQLAEDLAASGFSVEVLCGKPKEYLAGTAKVPAEEGYRGMRIRRIRYIQLSRESKIGRILNQFSFIIAVTLRWWNFLCCELIVVNTMPPLLPLIPALMNALFGRRFVFVCYDLYPDLAIRMGAIGRDGLIDRVMCLTNRLTYRRAARIVALGGEMERHMLSTGLVADRERIAVIPNWYDGDPALCTPLDPQPGPVFTVVYSGNMGVCQDMDTIMDCAARLAYREDIRFAFAGHGVKIGQLKERAEQAGLRNVTFHGYLMGNEFTALMHAADCFLLSLEPGIEGLAVPSKTYSYLAAGRPVAAIIAGDTDIAVQLTEYDAGFIVNSGDGEGLARVMEALAADRERQCAMGMNARRLFEERYRREICTGKYVMMIEDLLNESQRSEDRTQKTDHKKAKV